MVAHILRLKLRLLGNVFKRSPWQLVGVIIALLYGLGIALVLVAGLVGLRLVDVEIARTVLVVAGSGTVLGFLLLPLAFGVDDTLDPRRFALFGISSTRLATGLAAAALISVPSIVITIVALAQIVTWSRGILPTALGMVSAALIIATCVLGARVSTGIAAFLLSSRRARDFTGILAVVCFVGLAPFLALLVSVDWSRDGLTALERLAGVVGWTPLGAAWAIPADAAAGELSTAMLKLLIAIGFLGVLWVIWQVLVALMLVTPQRQSKARSYSGLGWFRWFARTPIGAIAARSLTYWGRDARYRVSLFVIPILPVFPLVALSIAGVDARVLALLPLPIMSLFLAWSTLHNDVAYDNSALWLHLASGTKGRQDRWGRAAPVLLIGVPLVFAGSFVSIWIWGDWTWLPSFFGFCICILLVGVGLSSVVSARFPYPVVRPGDSPFAQPQSSGTTSSLIQSLSFLLILVFVAPVAVLAALGELRSPSWHSVAFWTGLGIGLLVLFGGVALGSHIFNRRAPQLLEFTLQN